MTPAPTTCSVAALSPGDVGALCAHLALPTPTPDVPLDVIMTRARLTPDAVYAGLATTTDVRLMIAAAALRGAVRRLPADRQLSPAPLPPLGPARPALLLNRTAPPRPAPPARRAVAPDALPPDWVLVSAVPNPKRPGTGSWRKYEAYKIGSTVEEHRRAGLGSSDVRWDLEHGFVAFAPPASAEVSPPAEEQAA